MKKVIGIGGIFFKSSDPKALAAWYKKHLDIPFGDEPYGIFVSDASNPDSLGMTVFSFFKNKSDYFEPSTSPFMINFRVHDLVALLAELKAAGVEQIGEMKEEEYGKFAWILDPEGNKVELWQP